MTCKGTCTAAVSCVQFRASQDVTHILEHESQSRMQVIIHKDKIYLSHGAERARLIPTYHALIQRVRLRVKLPDMVIPLNPGHSRSAHAYIVWARVV